MNSRNTRSYLRFLKLLGFVLWTGGQLYAQCPTLKAIMVDPCGNDIRNEYIILDSGAGFNTRDLQISFDANANGGIRENNDININIDNFSGDTRPCRFQPGEASLITGCDNIRVASQGEEIPPNAIVIIQTSGNSDEPYDFSFLCGNGECVYVLQNDCIRTKEAFSNQGSGTVATLIAVANTQCRRDYEYNRSQLDGGDGAFYTPGRSTVYGNRGCGVVPPITGGTIPPEFVNPGNLFSCGPFTLPAVSGMHLTGGELYFTGPYGTGISYAQGSLISRSTTLFIYDYTAPCSPLEMFRVNIVEPETPALDIPNPLCAQDTPYALPTVQDGIEGRWTGDAVTNNIFNPDVINGGVYNLTFVPDDDECAIPNSMDVTVLSSPVANTDLQAAACNGNGAGVGIFDLTFYTQSVNGGTNDRVFWYEDAALNTLIEDSTLYSSGAGQVYAVIDNGACLSDPVPVQLSVGSTPTVRFTSIKNLSCFGDTDGGIEIEVSGGTPPYTIEWSDPTYDGQTVLSDLTAGPYTVTVTDSDGCLFAQTATLIEPEEIIMDCSKVQDVSTVVGADGIASFTATGGIAPYWVIWDGPELDSAQILRAGDTLTVSTLSAGFYEVHLRDALGCIASCQVEIDSPDCNLTASGTSSNPSCSDSSDGSISLSTSGAQGALTYTWNVSSLDGQSNPQNLPAGSYEVTVSDATGCAEILSFNLNAPPPLVLNCNVQNSVSVLGGSDGRARIQVGGGTRPYQASWTGPSSGNISIQIPTDFLIENLPAGTYDLLLVDARGCEANCSFTIEDGNCSSALTITPTNESCPDTGDGSIQLDLTGNWITPVTYDWNDDTYDGLSQLNDLAPGEYAVTVTGANGCQASISATIGTDFSPPEVTFDQNAAICLDYCHTFELNFIGTAPFFAEFIIRNGNQTIPLNVNADANTATLELCPADYGITSGSFQLQLIRVSDNNCINDQPRESLIEILQPTEADLSPTICPNESVTVNGQVYDFNRPSGTEILAGANQMGCDSIVHVNLNFASEAVTDIQETICPGENITINGEVFDENNPSGIQRFPTSRGCDSLVNIQISFYPPAISRREEILCPGEEIVINGTTYNAQNPSGTELYPGAGSNGCDSILEISVTFYPEAIGTYNETICLEDEVVINGTTYNRENPSGMEVFPGGSVNGCDSTLQVALEFFDMPMSVFRDTICREGSITVNGTIYDINNPSGTEMVSNPLGNGCDSLIQVELAFFDVPTSIFRDTICREGSIMVNGTIYNINNPSGTEMVPNPLGNGCDSLIQVELAFFNVPMSIFRDTICREGSITVNGTIYDINNPSGTETVPNPLGNGCDSLIQVELAFFDVPMSILRDTLCPEGSITVNGTVYDINNPSGTEMVSNPLGNGCDSLIHVELVLQEDVSVALIGDQNICRGEDAILEFHIVNALTPVDIQYATNGTDPVWVYGVVDGDQLTVSPMSNATYTILQALVPPEFCMVNIIGSASVQVSDLMVDAVSISDYSGYGVSCADATDGAITLDIMSGTGPFEYVWQDGVRQAERTNLGPGTYSVMVTDAFGCPAEALVQLEAPPPVQARLSSIPPDCDGGLSGAIIIDTVFGGNPPYFFRLNDGNLQDIIQSPFMINGLAAGRYTVEIADEYGCGTTQEVVIGDFAPLELLLDQDKEIRYGESVRLDGVANFQIDSLVWTPSDSLSPPNTLPTRANPATTTTYRLTAYDSRGCFVTDEIKVTVTRENDIYVPNAFTPNNDGINDRVYPFTNPNIRIIDDFRIFDRWGNQMHHQQEFQGNQEKFGWDGKYNNQPMDPAVFIFVVQFTYLDGRPGMLKGDVTLIR